ncbi:type II toxin-antitoxin system RelE/ParE family toxin [Gynuella sunshinyii]|uniref:Plasmid stabilization system protein n=1 Tax=Gynuella sunshinyii YC6258 TaxID=1445510 RepID=A0A0C5VX19_9GAMM|nr:type II toxin-antitoxin system RelE/ParE family toxin [Gynuella sunshinyii]AJQ97858.1 hypothetical Protein YC6258_05830 [Gynuella sunshinyii YC6258]
MRLSFCLATNLWVSYSIRFQNYRIIYLVKPDYLYIVAVVHGSRDLTRMESKPWEVV